MHSSPSPPILELKKDKNASILRKHRWIFSGALQQIPADMPAGSWVWVCNHEKEIVASGFLGKGSIAVRIVSFAQAWPEKELFVDLFSASKAYRKAWQELEAKQCTGLRLFHGEGDGIPGLVVDAYGPHLVIQGHHEGIDAVMPIVQEVLEQLYQPETMYFQPIWQGKQAGKFLKGTAEGAQMEEYGLQLEVNWLSGQKTGMFLDQRENRQLARKLAGGKKVLNAYSYTGGFSLACLQGGATEVLSIDISASAMQQTEAHIAWNGLDAKRHQSHVGDVPLLLKNLKETYDLVILDPPAFAKKRSSRHQAIQAYRRLSALGFRVVNKPGWLMVFSCSGVVDAGMFRQAIYAGALDAGVVVRVVKQLEQPGDHPVDLFHPETSYLKGLLLYVEN